MNDSEHTALIRDSATAYANSGAPLARARKLYANGRLDRAAWRDLAELGWFGLMAPEAHGGSALGMAEIAALLEALGRAALPEPLVLGSLLAGRIAARASEPAAVTLGSDIVCGAVVPLAWQEHAGALAANHIAMQAERRGAGWHLSGEKRFVAAAADADAFLVAARAKEGLALFLVPRAAKGLALNDVRSADGASIGHLKFNDVAPNALIAAPGKAQFVIDAALEEGRVALSAQMLGVMEALFDRTLDYLRTRKQFGRAIGSFQALQHRAVDLHIGIELSRSALRRAVRTLAATDDLETCAVTASGCKARVSEVCLKVAREAIQLHGAIGYTDELDVGILVRQAVALAAALGNATTHRRRYGPIIVRHLAS